MSGYSLMAVLNDEQDSVHTPDETFGGELHGRRTMRQGNWKIVWSPIPVGRSSWELFDIDQDPGETRNLSSEEPEVLQRLVRRWDDYVAEHAVILPGPMQEVSRTATAGTGDLIGNWSMTMETPMGSRPGALTITVEDGIYAGVMKGERGDVELTDIKIDGDTFEFIGEMNAPFGSMTLLFKGVIEGDKIAGTASGMMGTRSFSGEREVSEATSETSPGTKVGDPVQPQAAGLAGNWSMTMETPMGDRQNAMTITVRDGAYAGVMKGERGEAELQDFKIDGNKFEFLGEMATPMGGLELLFRGTIDGDKITGTAAGMMGEISFTGERDKTE
jgi:hypothetical protein